MIFVWLMTLVAWAVDVTFCVDIDRYSAYTGSTAGCATFPLSTGLSYTVKMLSNARVNSSTQTIVLKASPTTGVYAKTWETNYVAPATTTTRYYHQTGGIGAWSVLTAAAWALNHRDGGLSNETWYLYDQYCPNTTSQCFTCDTDGDGIVADDCGGTDTDDVPGAFIRYGNDAPLRYNVAHELGHYLLHKRNESRGSNNSPSADNEDCHSEDVNDDNHELQSKEMLNDAWHEGFANFYAAVTFNDGSESDCAFNYYKVEDWDLNGVVDTLNHESVNCESIPDPNLDAAVTAHDYLYDSNVTLGCGTTLANRATELDFLRFWWDLYTDDGWTFTRIVDVVDLTDPHTWIGGTSDTDPDGVGVGADLPTPTIQATLANRAWFTAAEEADWNAQAAEEGVDR